MVSRGKNDVSKLVCYEKYDCIGGKKIQVGQSINKLVVLTWASYLGDKDPMN